jgi:hypothetical protein
MKTKFLDLTDDNIKRNKFFYDPEQIKYSIINNCLSLRILSKYQKLTPYICSKYVIFGGSEEKYGDCSEDRWLADYDILKRQPHLTQLELNNAHQFVQQEEDNEKRELRLMKIEDKNCLYFL